MSLIIIASAYSLEQLQYDPIPTYRDRSLSPLSPLSPRSLSRSPSLISRSPSPRPRRSRSRSRLPRYESRRDRFRPPPPRSPNRRPRRWDESDTWLDPEYEDWLNERRRREEDRYMARKRRRVSVSVSRDNVSQPLRARSKPVELMPSPTAVPLRMDDDEVKVGAVEVTEDVETTEEEANGSLNIRGASKVEAQIPKAENALSKPTPVPEPSASDILQEQTLNTLPYTNSQDGETSQDKQPPLSTLPPVFSSPSARTALRARLKLRLKLANEKKSYTESRAQTLRLQILENRARREAEETDAVLRRLDKGDRDKEIRRRLMVEKMLSAETESERRARVLKERLVGERKERLLKEKLKMKRKANEPEGDIVVI
jgi:E3 ubiquitin-protein ligase Topors